MGEKSRISIRGNQVRHRRPLARARRVRRLALAALLSALAATAASGLALGTSVAPPVTGVPRSGLPAQVTWADLAGPAEAREVPHGVTPTDTAAFELFAWVSPPVESTTEARIAEMAAIGLNLTLPAWLDSGRVADNLQRLGWAGKHGMRCVIWDSRFEGAIHWLPSFEDTLDRIVADYREQPAFYAYYLGDEPPPEEWPLLARLRVALRARDPYHPAWNNLRGISSFVDRTAFEAYLHDFAAAESPTMICADHYDFLESGDRDQFVENTAALRTVADAVGLPFWDILQLLPHGPYRALVPGELRWQVAHLLAHGAHGIGYFTYWTPDRDSVFRDGVGIIARDGTRTPWYDFLLGFNPGVRAAGETLARVRWRRTTYAGSVPPGGVAFAPDDAITLVAGRAAIGEFDGADGERLVLVANSDSIAARTVTLRLAAPAAVRLVAAGSSNPLPAGAPPGWSGDVSLALEAGDFALLAIDPLLDRPASLALAPNPASGLVRFAPAVPASGASLEILDLSGRHVWSRRLDAGVSTVEWRGERDDGGSARPGLYFARVRGGGGGALRRFVWLGAR
jgi:hypothetical protein